LLAVRRNDGQLLFNPADDAVLAAGDTFIVVGPSDQLERADELALSAEPPSRAGV
jgi:K+/H+ antiporter YhaU regulatory subunit KhtT